MSFGANKELVRLRINLPESDHMQKDSQSRSIRCTLLRLHRDAEGYPVPQANNPFDTYGSSPQVLQRELRMNFMRQLDINSRSRNFKNSAMANHAIICDRERQMAQEAYLMLKSLLSDLLQNMLLFLTREVVCVNKSIIKTRSTS
jgi:hypothetical protein